MNFSTIRPALRTLLRDISGVKDANVGGREQREPYANQTQRELLRFSFEPTSRVGQTDHKSLTYDVLEDKLLETVSGYRRARWSIQSVCYEQTDGQTAFDRLETVRTKLGLESSLARLRAVNVAVWEMGEIIPNHAPVDERIASIATLDVTLGFVATETDPEDVGYFETIEWESVYS